MLNLRMSPGQNRRKSLSFSSSEHSKSCWTCLIPKITTALLRQDTTPPVMNVFALEALCSSLLHTRLRFEMIFAKTHCCWEFYHSWIKGSGSKIAPFRGALCPVQVLTQRREALSPTKGQKYVVIRSIHQTFQGAAMKVQFKLHNSLWL